LKIAHISDLHLNSKSQSSNYLRIKAILKYISKEQFDHLVITGDLTDNASTEDFVTLRNLFKRFGFLSGDKLSIVIGNHDIFGGVQNAEDIFEFPKRSSHVDFNQKINEFISFFPETLENCFYISPNGYFPYAKIVGDVLLIGLNSNAKYSSINNPFASNGEISTSQFTEMLEILKMPVHSNRQKLILIHHHFNKLKAESRSSLGRIWQNIEKQTMKLKNKKRLLKLFNDYHIDLVLHGHIHQSKEYFRKGIRFLNAGGSIKNNKSKDLFINSVKINKTGININVDQIESSSIIPESKIAINKHSFIKRINRVSSIDNKNNLFLTKQSFQVKSLENINFPKYKTGK